MARKGVQAVRDLRSGAYDDEIEPEDPKPVFVIVPNARGGFTFHVADPDVRIERASQHFNDLFEPVQEDGRVVPYEDSLYYEAHVESWAQREPADVIAELRDNVLPRLKTLRKRGTNLTHRRAVVDGLNRSLLLSSPNTAEDALVWHVVADVRYQPSFWADLREEDPDVIDAIERACRPGINRKAGRRDGKTFRHADTQQAMARFERELRPRMKELKQLFNENRQPTDLRAEQVEDYVQDFRDAYRIFRKPAVILELTKKLERDDKPSEIAEWLARLQFPPVFEKKRVKSR